jgi:hypothetical protein
MKHRYALQHGTILKVLHGIKAIFCISLLVWSVGKSIETESILVVARDWGRWLGSDCLMGARTLGGTENVLELDSGTQA